MNRKALLWVGLVLVLAAGSYLVITMVARLGALSQKTREGPAVSTYAASPKGYKAAYLFLRECGVSASRRTASWLGRLPGQGLLIVAEPVIPPSPAEQAALRRWVAGGGTALLLAREPWNLWPVGGKRALGNPSLAPLAPLVPTGLTTGVSRLCLAAPFRLRGPFDRRDTLSRPPVVLAGDAEGAAVLVAPHGRGRAILAADAQFLANERLKSAAGNAVFLYNLARAYGIRRVQFDEYHLGLGEPTGGAGERLARLPPALAVVQWQLLFVLALYFYMVGKRFGRPEALPETGGRTITEYITSLATLYQRARAGTVALAHLYQGLLERMRLLTGLSSTADLDLLATSTADRLGMERRDLAGLLARCRAVLAEERIGPAELLTLARRIDTYRKELEKWVTLPR